MGTPNHAEGFLRRAKREAMESRFSCGLLLTIATGVGSAAMVIASPAWPWASAHQDLANGIVGAAVGFATGVALLVAGFALWTPFIQRDEARAKIRELESDPPPSLRIADIRRDGNYAGIVIANVARGGQRAHARGIRARISIPPMSEGAKIFAMHGLWSRDFDDPNFLNRGPVDIEIGQERTLWVACLAHGSLCVVGGAADGPVNFEQSRVSVPRDVFLVDVLLTGTDVNVPFRLEVRDGDDRPLIAPVDEGHAR